jgi:dolichol-phosphate mannosyltransferase
MLNEERSSARHQYQGRPVTSPINLELAIVIPTYNERENILPLLAAVDLALTGIAWEAVVVDDNSPDGTAKDVREAATKDLRIRILERIGRRSLSSACIEGVLATSAPYIAVMDGDFQHDERILPKMLHLIKEKSLDVVIATRRASGGSMGEIPSYRLRLSNLGAVLSRRICHCDVSDPMSGFFIINRIFFHGVVHKLTGSGFKILVDLLASSSRPVCVAEIPYHFRPRKRGQSKLDLHIELEYLYLIADKLFGRYLPTRFALFVLVGTFGLVLHLSVLCIFYYLWNENFAVAQVLATGLAMTLNFVLNNLITFRDRRLRGRSLIRGLIRYFAACSLGAFINISFASALLGKHIPWYIAGLAGMAISSVWNYGVNTVLTWKRNTSANQWR